MTVHQFPTGRVTLWPTMATVFPTADEGLPRAIDERDREMWDHDAIEVQDDILDQWLALPVRVGVHYGEPTIEVGRYSLTPDAARVLAALLTKFAGPFREVKA